MPNTPKKRESVKNVEFAKGGTTPMFGTGDRTTTAPGEKAGEAKPAVTGKETTGGGGQYAAGGSTKMFGFSPSMPAKAGQTGAR